MYIVYLICIFLSYKLLKDLTKGIYKNGASDMYKQFHMYMYVAHGIVLAKKEITWQVLI